MRWQRRAWLGGLMVGLVGGLAGSSGAGATTLAVPLTVEEQLGVARVGEPVLSGVPLPREAQITDSAGLALVDAESGQVVPADLIPTARWGGAPDDATRPIKWLLLAFQASVPASGAHRYLLVDYRPGEPTCRLALTTGPAVWTVDTGSARFEVATSGFDLFHRVTVGGQDLVAPAADNGPYTTLDTARFNAVSASGGSALSVLRQGAHGQTLTLAVRGAHRTWAPGDPTASSDDDLEYRTYLTFSACSAVVRISHTVQNDRNWAALENNADFRNLGSPGSVYADEIGLRMRLALGTSPTWQIRETPAGGANWGQVLDEPVTIVQDSAGGDGWDAQRARHGTTGSDPVANPLHGPASYVSFRGFEVQRGGTRIAGGERMSGFLDVTGSRGGVAVALRDFWQSFPKALRAGPDGVLDVALWPAEFRARHTLRVGEQKTHEILFAFHPSGSAPGAGLAAAAAQPLFARADGSWYAERTRAVPTVSTAASAAYRFPTVDAPEELLQVDVTPGEWDAYLLRQLVGPGAPSFPGGPTHDYSFDGLHEAVAASSLYGWLDYGDLPIDFEQEYSDYPTGSLHCGGWTRSTTGQFGWKYDADWGLLAAFARSGDRRFLDAGLAAARHTADIDVLHHGRQSGRGIADFRDGGMFGHSQHDLDMDRNPHRNGDPQSPCGGAAWNGTPTADMLFGLGGMALGYQLTGDPALADAARDLAEWAAFFANTYDTDEGRPSANLLDTLSWATELTGDDRYRLAVDHLLAVNSVLGNPMGAGWQRGRVGAALAHWTAVRHERDDHSVDARLRQVASAAQSLDAYSGDAFRADGYGWAAMLLERDRAANLVKAREAFASAVLWPAWQGNYYGIQRAWQVKEWVNALRAGHAYQLAEYVLAGGPPFLPCAVDGTTCQLPAGGPQGGQATQNGAPFASFSGPSSIGTTEVATFDASASSDPPGRRRGERRGPRTPASELRYHWDFGDGWAANGAVVSHAWAVAGSYRVRLWVSDGEAVAATRQDVVVHFVNHAPTARAGADRSVPLAVAVAFDGAASTDPDEQPLAFAWTFGDGGSASTALASHSYAAAGNYPIHLTVSDGELTATDEARVSVLAVGSTNSSVLLQDGLDGYTGTTDTRLWSKARPYNYGSCDQLYVGRQDYPELNSLVRFDLGALPAGARVEVASLELATAATSSKAGVRVHRVTSAWTEGTHCTSTLDGATWDTGDGTAAWQAVDGGGDLAAPQASFVAAPVGTFATADVTAIVQDWLLGTANHGFGLTLDPSANFQFSFFHSAEATGPSLRPRLRVTYSPLLPAPPVADGFESGDLAAWPRLAP